MGGHSDPPVQHTISTSEALTAKLKEILGQLEQALASDFLRLLGVPIPTADIVVDSRDFDLVSAQTSVASVIAEYESGAATLVQKIPDPTLRASALSVVKGVLGLAQQQGAISVGGYAASERASAGPWVSAVLCEVEFGSHQDWGTPVDFFIIKFVFLVWSPPALAWSVLPAQMTAPKELDPKLDETADAGLDSVSDAARQAHEDMPSYSVLPIHWNPGWPNPNRSQR